MCDKHLINKRKPLCENVNFAIQNSTALAMAINLQLNNILIKEKRIIDRVYIAAPPTLYDFVKKTSENLKKIVYDRYKVNIEVFSLIDLRKHAKQLLRFVF